MRHARTLSLGLVLAAIFGLLTLDLPTSIASRSSSKSSPKPAVPIVKCNWDTTTGWVARENKRKGDPRWSRGIPIEYAGDFSGKSGNHEVTSGFASWVKKSFGPKSVIGWLDAPSATCGNEVGLHISGNAVAVTVKLYRMGYYQGAGARLIEKVTTGVVKKYPAVQISPAPISTVTTTWPVAWNFKITDKTPPGQYLIRLEDNQGDGSFVPLTIVDPLAKSNITFISSVLTWQAYNEWGGYSLYKGPNLRRTTRAMVVSFNRPYDGDGAGQFRYMEFPILRLAEKLGIDLNYITDLELDKNVPSLQMTKSILFGGHSEYWTTNMRTTMDSLVAKGINLVSLGGNAAYNRPRLQAGGRELVMWRGNSADPNLKNPILATTRWRSFPILKPEAALLGSQYVGLGVDGSYTITHGDRWPFNAMKHPSILNNIVGKEVDSPLYALGPPVEELASSVITLRGNKIVAMATYYVNASGAGILDIGTNGWACTLDNICPWHPLISAGTQNDARLVTETILMGMSKGPLSVMRPAIPNIPARTNASQLPKLQ